MSRFTLFLACCFCCVALQAEQSLSACEGLQRRVHAPLFATPLVSPWGYWSENQRPAGMLYDVSIELARVTGVSYFNQMQPYTRTVHSLKSGQADFSMIQGGKGSYEGLTWIDTLVETEIFMVGRKEMPRFSNLGDLDGQLVGHIRASRYGKAFDEAPNFKRVSIPELKQGLAMLMAGRIDVMTSADITLYQTMKEMQLDGRHLKRLLTVNRIGVSMFVSNRSTHQDLVPCYRQALESLRASGYLRRIFYVDEIAL